MTKLGHVKVSPISYKCFLSSKHSRDQWGGAYRAQKFDEKQEFVDTNGQKSLHRGEGMFLTQMADNHQETGGGFFLASLTRKRWFRRSACGLRLLCYSP